MRSVIARKTMASDEFISLDATGEADAEGEEGGDLQVEAPDVNRAEPQQASELQPEGEAGTVGNNPKPSDGNIDLEEGQLEDMDLADDDVVVVKDELLDDSVQPEVSVAAVQTVIGFEVKLDKGIGAENAVSNSISVEESPARGVKRARVESKEPSVRVIYSDLTRESKRKLMELMQQWSQWQARRQHRGKEAVEEILESGEETYYPALHVDVGSKKSCAVSFWVDNQARESATMDDESVPLYDREFTLGSTPLGDSSNTERADKDDSRCFNCGSYSHALKDCPKPRDNVAISNARKQHNLKRNQSNVNRVQNRYYQKTPGKFDDLKAGVLGPETRECLGIGENDPPPWLHRMRELGYPPGYLDVVDDEDKPSGITIFGDGEVKLEYEEGELPDQGEPSPPRKRMTVEFPGINAPIPENGDPWLWGSTPPQSSARHHSSDSRDYHDRGTLGADHYSSRYHSHDYGQLSPSLGRSHSDRGWRCPSRYDNLPADDGAWTPHSYPSRQYSGQDSSSSEMSSRHYRDRDRDRDRDRLDSRHYHHRR
ncbi:uncharacterized protein LOC120705046 isoform X3 [Panicum virgatum]|uniref:CCHC-type domain-containing protein n=1 Tax=Panicum virgatum TaxID=38727 RepID=A0A8T0XPK9_PANVG|nr:uncharacterized protein LOC120705046 isoform X3 [Panicum virgatum]KAG2659134.1 hypothetical protein PVAP13_1KG334300 [Panicum virgatum]